MGQDSRIAVILRVKVGTVALAYNLSRISVLIVEDNLFMRQLLRGVLTAFGVRSINEAVDGTDALQAVHNWTPDIMFVDWEMEPMNGIEFTKLIRQHESAQLNVCPIIMVSSYTTIKRISSARDSGVNEFLAKPISPQAIYSRIVMTIEHPRQFVQVGQYFGPDRRRKVEEMAGDERRRTEAEYVPIAAKSLSKSKRNIDRNKEVTKAQNSGGEPQTDTTQPTEDPPPDTQDVEIVDKPSTPRE